MFLYQASGNMVTANIPTTFNVNSTVLNVVFPKNPDGSEKVLKPAEIARLRELLNGFFKEKKDSANAKEFRNAIQKEFSGAEMWGSVSVRAQKKAGVEDTRTAEMQKPKLIFTTIPDRVRWEGSILTQAAQGQKQTLK